MGLLLLLCIPLMVGLAFYIGSTFMGHRHYRITMMEFLVQVLVVVLLMTGGYYAARYQSTSDTELWNAQVSEKKREKVSCEHSYQCHCRTYKCGKSFCTHCDTCYEHFYDVSWYVYTTAGEHFSIDRVNRQGTDEPPRWTAVRIGDPTARLHSFTNYIKANPWSLLNKTEETTHYAIPSYPLNLYDYHYVDRMVHVDPIDHATEWNRALQELNAELGVAKQVNIIVVVTKESEAFSHALQNAWLGGKKNDLIVVIGSKDGHAIDWARVVSWSHSEILKVEVRDGLLDIGSLDNREQIVSMLKDRVNVGFNRMEMEDYKYLLAGMEPSDTVMWVLIVLGILCSSGLSWFFYVQDTFDEN